MLPAPRGSRLAAPRRPWRPCATSEACRGSSDLVRDVRLGFRAPRPRPTLRSIRHVILGLGIGTSVTMFSILNAVVLRPLPYARPAEFAILTTHDIVQNQWDGTSVPNFLDWREQSASFAGMTFYRRTHVSQVTFRKRRRAATGSGGSGRPGILRTSRCGAAHWEDLLARGIRAAGAGRRAERGALAGTIRTIRRSARADALDRRRRPRGDRGDGANAFNCPRSDTRLWRPITVLSPSWESRTPQHATVMASR